MQGWQVAVTIIACVVPMDTIVVWFVIKSSAEGVLEPLWKAHPYVGSAGGSPNVQAGSITARAIPSSTADTRVRKEFQTIGQQRKSLGGFVHMEVDARHLHILPAWLPRKMGCLPASVPWEAIKVIDRKPRLWSVQIDGKEYRVPAWVGEIAGATPE